MRKKILTGHLFFSVARKIKTIKRNKITKTNRSKAKRITRKRMATGGRGEKEKTINVIRRTAVRKNSVVREHSRCPDVLVIKKL